eukprot:6693686-Prymnesium_polylepis.1
MAVAAARPVLAMLTVLAIIMLAAPLLLLADGRWWRPGAVGRALRAPCGASGTRYVLLFAIANVYPLWRRNRPASAEGPPRRN